MIFLRDPSNQGVHAALLDRSVPHFSIGGYRLQFEG